MSGVTEALQAVVGELKAVREDKRLHRRVVQCKGGLGLRWRRGMGTCFPWEF